MRWKSVLNDTDELCRLVKNTRLTVAAWDRQKRIFANPKDYSYAELGFATFFLNRTNRSGILNAGVIGGRDQTGPWKIDARYNADAHVFRIECTDKNRRKIKLSRSDALALLRFGLSKWDKKTLIYLDPPYYQQGRDLYYDYYEAEDHVELAAFIRKHMQLNFWIISYDNVPPINILYAGFRREVYSVGYSSRAVRNWQSGKIFSPYPRRSRPCGSSEANRQYKGWVLTLKKPKLDSTTVDLVRRVLSMPPKHQGDESWTRRYKRGA